MSATIEPAKLSDTSLNPLRTVQQPTIPFGSVDKSIIKPTEKKNKQAVASYMSRTLKDSFGPEMVNLIEPYHSVKLTATLRSVFVANDVLSVASAQSTLETFDFNSSNPFDETVSTRIFVKQGSHNGYAILHIPAFVPANELKVPDEATNFKISARLVAVSDFVFSQDNNSYLADNAVAHGSFGAFETPMLPVLRMQTQPITTQVCINKCKPIEGNVHTVCVVAVKFFNYDQGKFIHLEKSGTMKIMKVF